MSDFSEKVRAAIALQKKMKSQFVDHGLVEPVRYVGGADIAFPPTGKAGLRAGAVGSIGLAVALVWDMVDQRVVEMQVAHKEIDFPYIPGLLSFREEPLLTAAMKKIKHAVDVWMFDGHGISHPRGGGLATYMGLTWGIPTIGAAKSRLAGEEIGDELHLGGQVVAIRVTPKLYASPGNMVNLEQAVRIAKACLLPGHSIPEPTRIADHWSKKLKLLPFAEAKKAVKHPSEDGLFE